MRKELLKMFDSRIILFLFVLLLGSCASSSTNYNKRYNKVWKELIKSQAWKDALEHKNPSSTNNDLSFYVSTEDNSAINNSDLYNFISSDLFIDKYNHLVVRAYEKIIAEAVEADDRLEGEYLKLNALENRGSYKGDKTSKKDLAQVNKRFRAHREMLEGLKSWNIFSEFGTNDLEFFMAENKNQVYQMYSEGENEGKMVNFLVYKLADLYHFEN